MQVVLYYESAHSLKDKRQLSRSLKEKLRNKFNISIIEHQYQDLWQKLGLEWLYRVKQEPSRLGKRYLVTNVLFLKLLFQNILVRDRGINAKR